MAMQEKMFEPQSVGVKTAFKKFGNQSFSISSGPTRKRKMVMQQSNDDTRLLEMKDQFYDQHKYIH